MVASDPGLNRLRLAGSAALAMASALAIEFEFAQLTNAGAEGTLISMMLGAMMAMMGSMALLGSGVWVKVKNAVFFPVAIGLGMVVGVLASPNITVMLTVFVLVNFAAVYVRRFGIPFFFYGFMGWMGYFFASFLHATFTMMPSLLAAIVVGVAWVLLLSTTILNVNKVRTLRRTVRAFDARCRAAARAAAELLEQAEQGEPPARLRRRLHRQQTRVAEVALMVEGNACDPAALPDGWSGPALRRRLIDQQHAVDRLIAAADALAGGDSRLRRRAAATLDRLARRDDTGANRAAYALAEAAEEAAEVAALTGDQNGSGNGWWPARHLAAAATQLVAIDRHADAAPADEIDEFESVVTLFQGNLTGSPAVAGDVPARGWNPLAKLQMSTRQAIQVGIAGALAIVAGRELSDTRYYWAVLAAFVMFAGTATRAETAIKGFNRVLGTLVGLVFSILMVDVTEGNPWGVMVVIVASMFCGFYLMRLSYSYMIFFMTIMVGQLYALLHEFSDGFMVLRLEETSVGAAIGFVVALVVVPLSTRDTVKTARDNLLTALAALLSAVAERVAEPGTPTGPLDSLLLTLDERVRQLILVSKPLTRPIVLGNSPLKTRHRLGLYAATATHARELAVALRHAELQPAGVPNAVEPAVGSAEAAQALATAATSLTSIELGKRQDAAAGPLAAADTALFGHCAVAPGTRSVHPIVQPLILLHGLLRELAIPDERPVSTPAPESGTVLGTASAAPAPEPTVTAAVVGTGAGTDVRPPLPKREVAGVPVPRRAHAAPRQDRRPAPAGSTATTAPTERPGLAGTVTLPSGAAVPEPVILLLGPDGQPVGRTRGDARGRYRLDHCPAGEYVLTVTAAGQQPVAIRVAHNGGFTQADLELGGSPGALGRVCGTVRGGAGPVAGVTLTVVDSHRGVLATLRSDERGRYRTPELPVGDYTLVAAGFPPTGVRARLRAGEDHTIDLTMKPPLTHEDQKRRARR